jgi:hypothetical protein
LQQRGHSNAGKESGKSIPQRNSKNAAEIGAKCSQDAGLHHVQSPQQQSYATSKVEEDDVTYQIDLYGYPNVLARKELGKGSLRSNSNISR